MIVLHQSVLFKYAFQSMLRSALRLPQAYLKPVIGQSVLANQIRALSITPPSAISMTTGNRAHLWMKKGKIKRNIYRKGLIGQHKM